MKKRMFTPDFFSDEELVENLDIPGRLFYLGLWSVAEDSGVLLMSPLSLKMKLFPGDDVSPEVLQGYLDTLIRMSKIVTFEHGGKQYGWLKNFHRHQKLDNPPSPTLPLPVWIKWIESDNRRKRSYEVDESKLETYLSEQCPGHVQDKQWTSPHERKGKEKKGTEATEPAQPTMPLPITLDGYCREIEFQLISLGANPNYTAKAEEYQTIKQFYESNIPIDFVKRVIITIDTRQKEKKRKGPQTFSYCADAIREEWQKELIKQSDVPRLEFDAPKPNEPKVYYRASAEESEEVGSVFDQLTGQSG